LEPAELEPPDAQRWAPGPALATLAERGAKLGLEVGPRGRAAEQLAVEEKARRAREIGIFVGRRAIHRDQPVNLLRVAQALVAPRHGHPVGHRPLLQPRDLRGLEEQAILGQILQRLLPLLRRRPGGGGPLLLVLEQRAGEREETLRPVAPGDQRRAEVIGVANVVAILVADLPGPHIFGDQRAHALLVEMLTVGAGQRAEFDQLDLGLGVAHAEPAGRLERDRAGPVDRRPGSGAGRSQRRRGNRQRSCGRPQRRASRSFGSSVSQSTTSLGSILPSMTNAGVPVKSGYWSLTLVTTWTSWSIIFWSLRHWLLFAAGTPR